MQKQFEKKKESLFRREGLYGRVCSAAGIQPREKNPLGYLNNDEMMQILIKLTKGRISCNKKI
jgi:hypothetical protein